MFGSNPPFGQSSGDASRPSSALALNSNASNSLFGSRPFGSFSPFGSSTGSSVFGGNSNAVFGGYSLTSGSTSSFGAPSSPASGSSQSAFGAPSTPAFGRSSCSFGAFVQSSNNPSGSSPALAQNSNTSHSLVGFKPFGSTSPLGSTTGSSVFGGISNVVYGENSFPSGSTTSFGSPSSPAFGSSEAAFGTPSAPAFGSFSSSSGGSSFIYESKPAFEGFASSLNQFGSSGSSFQQIQNTVGSMPFGSFTPVGASITSSPVASSSAFRDAFAASNTFGTSNTSVFATPAFEPSSSFTTDMQSISGFEFRTSHRLGSSASASDSSSSSLIFGARSSSFGSQTRTPTFDSMSLGTSAFGGGYGGSRIAAHTPTTEVGGGTRTHSAGRLLSLSAKTTNQDKTHEELRWEDYLSGDKGGPFCMGRFAGRIGIGSLLTASNSFGSCSTLTQSSANRFSPLDSSNPFAPQASSSIPFGSRHGGSRVTVYTTTAEVDGSSGTATSARLLSLSSMTVYKDKSHEELRWEDYQTGDKGGIGIGGSTTQSNFFSPSSTPLHSSKNPLSPTTSSNPFGPATTNLNLFYPTPISQPSVSPNFSNPFAPKTTDLEFKTSVASCFPCFRTSSSANLFMTTSFIPSSLSTVSSSLFGPNNSPTFLSSTSALGTTSGFNSGFSTSSTQLSPVFQPSFGPTTAPSFCQPTIIAPSTRSGLGRNSSTFQTAATETVQTSGAFATTNFPESLTGLNGFVAAKDVIGQSTVSQLSTTQSTGEVQLQPLVGTFGVLPAVSQLSISLSGSMPSIQYGISSMPVSYKPASPVRLSSYLTCRHVSQGRTRLPARKYYPKSDGPKVPFFSYGKEGSRAPKADTPPVPRENPRAWVFNPTESWPTTAKMTPLLNVSDHVDMNETSAEIIAENEAASSVQVDHDGTCTTKAVVCISVPECEADEAATLEEHETDVKALLPQLKRSGYYTEPQNEDMAIKEQAEPGFCSRVKDFVVGRIGYGSIKFLGETDVRQLDLDSLIYFNNREVTVYVDEGKKPPIGQGLNKPAEVTLLNIKCINKKTGKQCTDGTLVEKYREKLSRAAKERGAELVSFNPVEGEWKFRVPHFNL